MLPKYRQSFLVTGLVLVVPQDIEYTGFAGRQKCSYKQARKEAVVSQGRTRDERNVAFGLDQKTERNTKREKEKDECEKRAREREESSRHKTREDEVNKVENEDKAGRKDQSFAK